MAVTYYIQQYYGSPVATYLRVPRLLGFKKYVVEYNYDNMGRLVNKTVRDTARIYTDTSMQDSGNRFETDYQYDGRGRFVRERIMRYDPSNGRLAVTQQ